MPTPGSALPAEIQRKAVACILAARHNPSAAAACPACAAEGLVIHDRSARPHAEWYQLVCAVCGLDHTFSVPVAGAASWD